MIRPITIQISTGLGISPRKCALIAKSTISKPSNYPRSRELVHSCSDRILDLLFKFVTSTCLRIVPPLFLRDMYRTLSVPRSQPAPKTPHYSPMLHNALVALATAFSDDTHVRDLKSRQYFVTAAKSYIDVECGSPNISVIHALAILGTFHCCQGEETLGYTYFGEVISLLLIIRVIG